MKTELLQLRISPQLKTALHVRAEELGMSVSEYVRYLLAEDIRRREVRREDSPWQR